MSVYDYTSPSAFSRGVPSKTGKDQALLSVCESSVGFYKLVRTLAVKGREPLWERACPFGGGRALLGEGSPFWERALSKCHIETLTY
jgi:hypothetical protein